MSLSVIFNIYLFVLFIALLIGVVRYRQIDKASKVIIPLLAITFISEIIVWFLNLYKNIYWKNIEYHIFAVIEFFIVSIYFFRTIKFKKIKDATIFCGISYPALGIINLLYVEPLYKINSYYITFESFFVIAMSLYALYVIFQDDTIYRVPRYPHFWFWTIFLFYFSSTFFFWSCIRTLFRMHSSYYYVALYVQALMNVITYSGIAVVLFFYPKMSKE